MFNDFRSFEDYATVRASPVGLFLLLGINFCLLGLLILIFQHLLEILVALFLFLNGGLFLALAWRAWRLKRSVKRDVRIFWDF